MSEMCYFLHDDIDMGAHIYTCGHQKEMTWGECPCKDGISCDFFVSKSEVDKLVRQYVNNREETERKRGKWIKKMKVTESETCTFYTPEWYCKTCGEKYDPYFANSFVNYCYVCGDYMRGVKKC